MDTYAKRPHNVRIFFESGLSERSARLVHRARQLEETRLRDLLEPVIKYFIDDPMCVVNDGIDSEGEIVGCIPRSSKYHPLFSFTLSFNGKNKFDVIRLTRHRNEQSLQNILCNAFDCYDHHKLIYFYNVTYVTD